MSKSIGVREGGVGANEWGYLIGGGAVSIGDVRERGVGAKSEVTL